ncbi:Serine protease [Penicillium canescens]|nr:Serine protease [Penicillium canescens]KAJ6172844.1 Serine protease [Penicillium canescens]
MPFLTTNGGETTQSSIPVWNLQGTDSDAPEKEEMIFLQYSNHGRGTRGTESIQEEDDPIVKLFLQFENSDEDDWAVATGWLARDDIVVTAGHCAFDWSYNLGRLNKVKVYAGYTGKNSLGDPEVEFHAGKRVATAPEWVEKPGRQADVAFIKLDGHFDEITPIEYKDTPEKGNKVIGVVGYPGDLRRAGEPGAIMHQHFEKTKWNLVESKWKMLEYSIDTNGGNSGSPVLDQEDMASIGVHTYGGVGKNSATVIGEFGHPFDLYIAALDKGVSKLVPSLQPECLRPNLHDSRTEGFDFVGNILKSIKAFPSPIPKDILLTNSSLTLGPLGVPAGAVAGIALGAAANAVGGEVTTAESGFENDPVFNGLAERAILGEAALAAIQKMSADLREEENIFTDIGNTVKKLLPIVEKVGSAVIKEALEPLLRLALDALRKASTGSIEGDFEGNIEGFPSLKTTYRPTSSKKKSFISAVSDASDKKTRKFVKAIATEGVSENAEFKFKWPKPPKTIPSWVTTAGQILIKTLAETDLGQSELPLSIEFLPLRAIVCEAALQAVLRIPEEKLEDEGLFDVMSDVVKRHGPSIIKVAPGVIKKVSPFFAAIANGAGNDRTSLPRSDLPWKKHMSDAEWDLGGSLGGKTVAKEVTNRSEVRDAIAAGGWNVLYGDLFNEGDILTFAISIPTGSVGAWVAQQIQAQLTKFSQSLNDVSEDVVVLATNYLENLLKGLGSGETNIQGLGVKGGFATYNRHMEYFLWGKKVGSHALPNNHHPYIALRVTEPLPPK